MDATRARVRDPQVLHLRPGSADGGRDAESGQDAEGMGLEYREKATDGKTGEKTEGSEIRRGRCEYQGNGCEARVGHRSKT